MIVFATQLLIFPPHSVSVTFAFAINFVAVVLAHGGTKARVAPKPYSIREFPKKELSA